MHTFFAVMSHIHFTRLPKSGGPGKRTEPVYIYIYILTSISIEPPCITPVSHLVSQEDINLYIWYVYMYTCIYRYICIRLYRVPRLFRQGAVKLVNEVTRNQVWPAPLVRGVHEDGKIDRVAVAVDQIHDPLAVVNSIKRCHRKWDLVRSAENVRGSHAPWPTRRRPQDVAQDLLESRIESLGHACNVLTFFQEPDVLTLNLFANHNQWIQSQFKI